MRPRRVADMTYTVPVPGGTIAVDERGTGPTVVLVHGGTSTAKVDWDPLLPWLDDYRVITYDQRGHGRSRGFDEGIGMDRFGLDLLHVLRHLGLPSAVFVGFSVGANTLLRLVPRHPSIAQALVLIGAGLKGRPERVDSITTGPWLPALIDIEHDDAADSDHWQRIRRALGSDWGQHHHVTAAQAARITCPTLVLHGDNDRVEPANDARGLVDLLPSASLQMVPDAGHMAQVDRPDVVGVAVGNFLADVAGSWIRARTGVAA